jgi:hypothetical protein
MAKMTFWGSGNTILRVRNQVSGYNAVNKIKFKPEKYHVFSEKQVKSLIRGCLEVYMNLYRDLGLSRY